MTDHLVILAPGLLGGSIARAARARGTAARITLWARRPESRQALRGQPWCDAVADTPGEAVRDATLVILCAPVDRIVHLAREIAEFLPTGVVVTDVGSVKGELDFMAHAALEGRSRFVGSHPMAGSEKTGWENGSEDLFEGRTCFVTSTEWTDPGAHALVSAFWAGLGARVTSLGPDQHDEIVAHISHLPQLAASALCAFLASRDPGWAAHAGGGLRDTTRIAGSSPALWRPILEQNREEVLKALRGYQDVIAALATALEANDLDGVEARMETGRAYRARIAPPPASP